MLALPLAAVVTLHASVAQMGVLRAASLLPAVAMGLFAGVWVDRMRRRPVLIATDLGRALVLGTIPLAAVFHVLSIGQLFAVALLAGVLTTFFDVAQPSLLPSLIPRNRLVEANGMMEVSRSVAMIAGPGLAGLLVQLVTAPVAILVDSVSFVGSALFLGSIHALESRPADAAVRASIWTEIGEGVGIVRTQPVLRAMATSLSVYNFFSSMISAVYVLYAVRDLRVGAALLGAIYAVGSVAFLIGASQAARVARRFGVGPAIVWGAGISDAGFLLVPVAHGPILIAGAILAVAQSISTLAGPVTSINQLSLRQTLTPDHLLGRVNAAMRTVAFAMGPAGALIAAALGAHVGVHATLVIGAIGMQAGFVILLLSPVRRLSREGIEMPSRVGD